MKQTQDPNKTLTLVPVSPTRLWPRQRHGAVVSIHRGTRRPALNLVIASAAVCRSLRK